MATCPRCGGRLDRYELWGREQHSCSDCGYVGVPVEHGSRREPPESWGDAIRRYQETGNDTTPESDRVDGVVTVPTAESPGSYLEPTVRRDGEATPTPADADESVPGAEDEAEAASEDEAEAASEDEAEAASEDEAEAASEDAADVDDTDTGDGGDDTDEPGTESDARAGSADPDTEREHSGSQADDSGTATDGSDDGPEVRADPTSGPTGGRQPESSDAETDGSGDRSAESDRDDDSRRSALLRRKKER